MSSDVSILATCPKIEAVWPGRAETVGAVNRLGVLSWRMACGAGCSSLTRVCFSLVFLSFLVLSVDHHGTFCTYLLLIVPGLLWYVLFLRFCSASGKIGRERLCQRLIATDDA